MLGAPVQISGWHLPSQCEAAPSVPSSVTKKEGRFEILKHAYLNSGLLWFYVNCIFLNFIFLREL